MDLNVEDRTLGKIVLSESVLEDQMNLDQVGGPKQISFNEDGASLTSKL